MFVIDYVPESVLEAILTSVPCLTRCKRLAADRHVIADFSLVPFVIINLTRLTVGVCMKVRFTSKVTRGFSFSSRRFATRFRRFAALMRRKIKKNLWDQGISSAESVMSVLLFVYAWSFAAISATVDHIARAWKFNGSQFEIFIFTGKKSLRARLIINIFRLFSSQMVFGIWIWKTYITCVQRSAE